MEAGTRRLAIISVSLGICVVTLIPVHAGLPAALKSGGVPLQTFALGFRTISLFDIIQNILLFAPLGYLMAAGPKGESRRGIFWAALACLSLSAAAESAQAWIPGRFPSCWDIVFNTVGGMAGARAAGFARSAFPSYSR
jgi:glycopeptide antibiotics resistance protein